jgi:SAM-dependent methyltransferase
MTETRKQHWENVYQNKRPDEVSWFQLEPEISLKLVEQCGVDKTDAIIDIGGGASRLSRYLYDAGYRDLSVLDISAAALEHARKNMGAAAGEIRWIECDITAFQPGRQYRLWHDRAVFHFLTDEQDRAAYLAALGQALPSRGWLILAAFSPTGPTQCSGLDIVQYDEQGILDLLSDDFDLREVVAEAHQTPAGKVQNFYYYRLQRQ